MNTQQVTTINELRGAALRDFEMDAADFIWKSSTLIDYQQGIEIAKLEKYFPNDEVMRKLRWTFERRKLETVFPA
jgi:hypothetical protein